MAQQTQFGLFSGPSPADLRRRRREGFLNRALQASQGGPGAQVGAGLASLGTALLGGPSDTQQINRAEKMQQARQRIQQEVGGIQNIIQNDDALTRAQGILSEMGLQQEAQRLPLEREQARAAVLGNQKTAAQIDALKRKDQPKQTRAITAVAGTPKAKALEERFGVTVPEGGTFEVKLENGVPQGVQRIAEERREDVPEQQIVTSGDTELGRRAGLQPGERGRVSFQEIDGNQIVTGVDLREQGTAPAAKPDLGKLEKLRSLGERMKDLGSQVNQLSTLEASGASGKLTKLASAIEADLKGFGNLAGLNFGEDIQNAATARLDELGVAEQSAVLRSALRNLTLTNAALMSPGQDLDRQAVEQSLEMMGLTGDTFTNADPSQKKAIVGNAIRTTIRDINRRIGQFNQRSQDVQLDPIDVGEFEEGGEDQAGQGPLNLDRIRSMPRQDLLNLSDKQIEDMSAQEREEYINRLEGGG